MKIEGPAKAIAIYIGDSDHWHGKPLAAALVELAKKEGMAGATVTHGVMGFGARSRIHTTHILRLSEDLPVTITIVDKPERVESFLPKLDEMIQEGMVMTWDVQVEIYRTGKPTDSSA